MTKIKMLEQALEYHMDCEPADSASPVHTEWADVRDFLQEARTIREEEVALEVCLRFQRRWKPTVSDDINDWRIFIREVEDILSEVQERVRVDVLSSGIDELYINLPSRGI